MNQFYCKIKKSESKIKCDMWENQKIEKSMKIDSNQWFESNFDLNQHWVELNDSRWTLVLIDKVVKVNREFTYVLEEVLWFD